MLLMSMKEVGNSYPGCCHIACPCTLLYSIRMFQRPHKVGMKARGERIEPTSLTCNMSRHRFFQRDQAQTYRGELNTREVYY